MRLTGPQLRELRWHLEHRDSPPTLGRFLRRFAWVFVRWIVCAALGTAVFVRIGWPEGAYLIGGMFLGAALRVIRQHLLVMHSLAGDRCRGGLGTDPAVSGRGRAAYLTRLWLGWSGSRAGRARVGDALSAAGKRRTLRCTGPL